MAIYSSAPAVGIIDSGNGLTFSWTPNPDGSGSFSQYGSWTVTVDATDFTVLPVWLDAPTNTLLGTQTFTQTLSSGAHTITMEGFNTSPPTAVTSLWLTNNAPAARAFPDVLTGSSIILSLSSVLLGQTLTITLNNIYTGADQWQVLWPDNSSTGWLPLSANVVAKSFSVPGAQNILVQTRRDYSGSQYNPPASLIRQISKQIFVIDQQQTGTTTTSGGLAGDLGIGGQQGFEIVDASSPLAVPNPWEIIARAFVRDTVTNELKLLVATTRFSNASSLLGTMAIDVFPIEGRPHSIELIKPLYELTAAFAETTLVKIATSALPNLIVGKSIAQAFGGTLALTVKTGTGVQPFLWTATGLPAGVTISSSGVVNGIPQVLGAFEPTFAVQDSSIPFSIDEATLSLTVITDLLVQIATGQTDAQNTALAPLGTSLGVARVGTPYKVQMQVGNINPTATTPGGLAPYQWSIPAGALPIGLNIDPDSGIISGVPCTYNSEQDYGLTYAAVIQVTDAIGAKATQTYTMSLVAAALQFGPIDQGTVFELQEFNLDVPVWGGQSPYLFNPGSNFTVPVSDASYYGTVALIDGRIEVPIGGAGSTIPGGFPTTATGGHSFALTISDSSTPVKTLTSIPINFQLDSEISDIRIVQASPSHYWDNQDGTSVTLPISGDLTGYTLSATTLVLNAAAGASGSPLATVYTGNIGATSYVGQIFTVQGFSNAVNNGSFVCKASTPTTLTLSNSLGVVESATAVAVLNLSPSLGNGIGVAIDATTTPPQVDATGPATTYTNSQLRIPLVLTQSGTAFGSISREYTFLAHNDSASTNDIGTFTAAARPYIVNVDTVGLNPRKPYFNSIATVPPAISGVFSPVIPALTARVQSGSSLPPGLSLDQNTGLIYGLLVGAAVNNSIIEYVDSGGAIHGTVTVVWTTYQNAFQPTNGGNVVIGSMGLPSTLTLFTAPSGITLVNPTIVYPLSNNIALGIPGTAIQLDNTSTMVQLVGTPTEAGYFDIWLQVQNSSNLTQFSYIYNRVVIGYAKPMIILTQTLPTFSNQAYSFQLQGFGGIPPYAPSVGTPSAGWSATGLPAGFTIDQTSGTVSASATSWDLTPTFYVSGTTSFSVAFTLTDQRGATTTATLPLLYDNRLRILTANIPIITSSPSGYSFAMLGAGGLPPYKWQFATGAGALPPGITFDGLNTFSGFDNADPTAGQFSGSWSGSPAYTPQTFVISLQDSTPTTVTGNFLVQTGVPSFVIGDAGVGTVNRGVPYQGTMSIAGTFVTPVSWQVAPTKSLPYPLYSGLTLQPNALTQGQSSVISGTYSGVPYQTESIVRIVGGGSTALVTTKQSHGFTATYTLTLSAAAAASGGQTVYTGTISGFPAGQTPVGQSFVVAGFTAHTSNNGTFLCTAFTSTTLTLVNVGGLAETHAATAANTQSVVISGTTNFNGTYTVASPITAVSFTIAAAFVGTENPAAGLATDAANLYTVRVIAIDSAANAAFAIVPLNTGTDLVVTTNTLPNASVGGSYNVQLTASGGVAPYVWSVDPISAATLSGIGLSLSGGGAITGSASGLFSNSTTFRVTDSLSGTPNIARATLSLVSQASGLAITTTSITSAISGLPYSFALAAGGDANTPYTWSIASGALPAGLSLSAAGVITGSSTAVGFSQSITFKVTDSIGANVSKALTVTVISGLALVSGIDFTDSLNTANVGYISSGQVTAVNPRPNLSFYIVATGVQSTSPSQMTVTTGNPNITGTVISITSGVARISLAGVGFANGSLGSNNLSVSVTDSGTTVTRTFVWVIYNDGTLRIGATLPTQLTTP
jgi:hypothetical protein